MSNGKRVLTKYRVHELLRDRGVHYSGGIEELEDGLNKSNDIVGGGHRYVEDEDFDVDFKYKDVRFSTGVFGSSVFPGFNMDIDDLAYKLGVEDKLDVSYINDPESDGDTSTDTILDKTKGLKVVDPDTGKDYTSEVIKFVESLEKSLKDAAEECRERDGRFDDSGYYKVRGSDLNDVMYDAKAEPIAVSLTFEEVRQSLDDKYKSHADEILAEITSHESVDVIDINKVMETWEANGIVFTGGDGNAK